MTEQEKQARPINCEALCAKFYQCTPFVNPVFCGRIELKEDIKDAIRIANYVRLADDQSLPVLRASPYPKPEHWDDVALENYISRQTQQDMQDAGFRKVEL